ncbi:MAG: RnfABCDGE type electron transport complex subunit G [Oscillospiraceae bacterium]
MKKINIKSILIPTTSLLVICIVVTALLAVTNAITAPKIAALSAENEEKAKKSVLTVATEFSEEKTINSGDTELKYFDGISETKENVGYVFLTSKKGYGGDIKIMVGVSSDGKVAGVQILQIDETAGLGMNAKKESFLSQFTGKSGKIGVSKTSPKENEIQALTGATITSAAMADAVNIALSAYETLKGVK